MRLFPALALAFVTSALSADATAGTVFRGRGADPQQACRAANRQANAFAHSHTTCYRACVSAAPSGDGAFVGVATAANQQGSCKKSGYTKPIPPAAFDPAPRPSPGPAPAPGQIQSDWQPGVPTANYATLILTNVGGQPATFTFEVWVRDAGYLAPAGMIFEGTVVLPPGERWVRQFHQWRAEGWRLVPR
jgi:hypothetical protein